MTDRPICSPCKDDDHGRCIDLGAYVRDCWCNCAGIVNCPTCGHDAVLFADDPDAPRLRGTAMSAKKKPPCHDYEGRAYAEGYDQGVWDTENRLGDDISEAQGDTVALESIAAQTVAYFGDLATTLRELPNLRPREVDVLKRVTRDAPITVVGGAQGRLKAKRQREEMGEDAYLAHRRRITDRSRRNPEVRERTRLGNRITNEALRRLRENHRAEYEHLRAIVKSEADRGEFR